MLRNLDTQEGMSLRPKDAKDMARNCCAKRSFCTYKWKHNDLKDIGNTNKPKIEWKSRLQGSLTRSSGILKVHLPPPPKIEKTEGFWAGLQCWRDLQGPSPVLNRPFLEASNLQSHDVSRCLNLGSSTINTKPLIKLSNYQLSKVYPRFSNQNPTRIQRVADSWYLATRQSVLFTFQPKILPWKPWRKDVQQAPVVGKNQPIPRQIGSFLRWKLKKTFGTTT